MSSVKDTSKKTTRIPIPQAAKGPPIPAKGYLVEQIRDDLYWVTEKYKENQNFSDSIKEKVLEKQHHRCADCNRVLNVVDWHHRNGDRSDNRDSIV
jgi:hypothetical protein